MAIVFDHKLFQILAPEFKDIDLATVTCVSDQAACQINENVWKDRAKLGLVYLTAHMFSMAQRAGAAGAIKRDKVSKLETEYEATGKEWYDQTSYGKEYYRLMRSLVTSPLISGC